MPGCALRKERKEKAELPVVDGWDGNCLWLSSRHLQVRFGISRNTLSRWVREGILPTPTRIATGWPKWFLGDIQAFEAELRRRTAGAGK